MLDFSRKHPVLFAVGAVIFGMGLGLTSSIVCALVLRGIPVSDDSVSITAEIPMEETRSVVLPNNIPFLTLTEPQEDPGLHRAHLIRVIDGDTFVMCYALSTDTLSLKHIRLLGVDTPELHPRKGTLKEKEAEKLAGNIAKDFSNTVISGAKKVYIKTDGKTDSFGRVLADVMLDSEDTNEKKSLVSLLLESGNGKLWKK